MNKTMKTAKIVIGIFFLVFSGLYLIGVLSYAAYAKSEATYYSSSDCLRMEFEESRYIGERAVTEWGSENTAEPGYGIYRMVFRVENQGCSAFYGTPAGRIHLDGENWDDRGAIMYHDPSYQALFANAARPFLPGKSQVRVIVYVEVKDGVDTLTASFWTVGDGDKNEIKSLLTD